MQTITRCIYPGELLLPAQPTDLTAWACLACDQFTSQPQYWEQVKLLVGGRPSTLNLILPECYLSEADARIPAIHQAMRDYLGQGVLTAAVPNGFILTERSTGSGARLGLIALLDLECYEYREGSRSPVRATEQTIEARLPPRQAVRRGAPLELSHVLLLMDDPMQSVVEPLFDKRDGLTRLYDFPLMLDGGHLTGYAVTDPADIQSVYDALNALDARRPSDDPLLFAVGDGNHGLAAAKKNWEEVKRNLSPEQTAGHPARFAMVELENIHDDALQFEPIHRVLFGYDGDDLLNELTAYAIGQGVSAEAGAQEIAIVYEGKEAALSIGSPSSPLAVGTLQAFLDEWLKAHPGVRLDYIHGEEAVRGLTAGEGAVGFLLPALDKSFLFPAVRQNGALPRKTFSLGGALDKRYYMECRKL